jgi:hypothetical protein
MHSNLSMRTLFLGGAVMLGVLAACSDTRSITTAPSGAFGFGTIFAKPTLTNVPRGTMRFPVAGALPSATPANDSIVVTLNTADSLSAGSVYVAWAANDSATKFWPLTGDLRVTRVDTTTAPSGDPRITTTVTTRTGVSSWAVGGSNVLSRFRASRVSAAGLTSTDSIGVILLSIETGAIGAAPSNVRFAWGRRSEATASEAGIRFGAFAPRTANQYVYANNGAVTITPRGRLEVRDGVIVVIDSNYFRPPRGFFYALHAVKVDSLSNRPIDTLYLGRRTSPYPERISLYTADIDSTISPVIVASQNVILAMNNRASADTMPKAGKPPFKEFGFVNVTLQNKAAPESRMGATIVMQATLPPSIRGR